MYASCVSGIKSNWLNVKRGVPQRTIFGSLYFFLYDNNFYNPNTETIQYADETLIFAADKNLSTASEVIETQIERLYSYFGEKNMQLKALKTEFVLFSKHANLGNLKMPIKVEEETIHANKSINYLGKNIDCAKSFQSQIKTMVSKMATSIRDSHQIRKSLPSTTRLVLFKTLVIIQLEGPIFLFTGFFKTQINSLDKQINWGIKTALFAENYKDRLT